MIKPEGIEHKDFIHHRLSQHGLLLSQRKTVVLSQVMIDGLYPDLPPAIKKATLEHLKGKEVEVLLIQGENAIRTVMGEVGEHKIPANCDVGSIRSVLADKTTDKGEIVVRITERLSYHKNFVHRANGPEEVELQAKLFGLSLK